MTCGYMRFAQYPLAKQECARANVGFSFATCLQTAMVSSYCRAMGFRLPAPNRANILRVPHVCRGIVGVEFQSLLVLSLSSGKIPVVLHLVTAQNGMGMSQRRV